MKRLQLLTIVMIVIALGAGAAIKSNTSANSLAVPRQAVPTAQPATTAHSATMPIVIVPIEAVDPTARLFMETGDGSNGSRNRP
jgi:hypothetical protein